MERSPDHRDTKAATHAARWVTAALRARARASKRMKAAASAQQGPSDGPSLDRVFDLATNERASRLPLRP